MLLSLGASACSAIAGEHEVDTKFLVKPTSQATFSGWSEITVEQDPNSVDSAELMYVRLEAQDNGVRDLSFIKGVAADAVVGGVATRVAQKVPMPAGERIVPLDRVHKGDIRKFFYEDAENGGYTVHIDWQGTVDLAKQIPAEGVWMRVKVAVRIE